MKKIYSILSLLIASFVLAQAPQGFSYQAIAFDTNGDPIQSSPVSVRIGILNESATGTLLYQETHSPTTNAQGLFNLNIGLGTPTTGAFTDIDWGNGSKFIKVELDTAGGTNFVMVGTNQLMSVPYALYAENGGGSSNWNLNDSDRLGYANGDIELEQAGSGIWLTSPDGTKYKIAVNDNGELSLPTSNTTSDAPTQLYLYGSFNGWDAANALQLNNFFFNSGSITNEGDFFGIRYFTQGTELRFLAAQNESVVYGGNGLNGDVMVDGNAIVIPNDGFYYIKVDYAAPQGNYEGEFSYEITSSGVELGFTNDNFSYSVEEDEFNLIFYDSNLNQSVILVNDNLLLGDDIGNGNLDINGSEINYSSGSNIFTTKLNFNGTGTYEVFPIENARVVLRDSNGAVVSDLFYNQVFVDFISDPISVSVLQDLDVVEFKFEANSANPIEIGGSNGIISLTGDWIPLNLNPGANEVRFRFDTTNRQYSISYN